MSDNNPTVTVPMDGLYVHYIDVGQGDSELLCCGGQYMLIDAGAPSCRVIRSLSTSAISA